jgi:Protein of unknown function (DUF1553)/Protein of unknown function (DUF1549)
VASSRVEVLTEMTNIVGAAFLGVTIGCARCHDHKFDPIRQSDYYRMQGYFAQAQFEDVVRATPEEQKAWKEKAQPVQVQLQRVQRQLGRAEGEEKLKLEKEAEDLDDKLPPPLTAVFAVKDDPKRVTPIHLLERGDYLKKGDKVGMRPLGVLLADNAPEIPIESEQPRTKLAEWVTDPANPLTARVMVNRIWQYHFGRGIVGTANDFGRMGTRPSHPELLDYLANRFIAGGWKMKPVQRMILLSSAYRQASQSPIEKIAAEKDSENTLLWKFNRRRMEAEELRDSMLAVSGQLNPKSGGPSVLVPIEPELVKMLERPQYWVATRDKSEYNRRTMYLIYKRNLRLPFMEVFDGPDMQFSCSRREQSTHAPQALEMLNGKTANDLAAAFAARLLKESPTSDARINQAWRLAAGRPPTLKEKALAAKYLVAAPEDPALVKEFALAVLNLNSFLYIN